MAQHTDDELVRVLFIFDGSNSMNGKWQSNTKIEVARKLLGQALDSLKGEKNLQFALRVYGHQTPILKGQQDCNDTKLEVPFANNNNDRIKAYVKAIAPKGTTPIARSLEQSAKDFPPCDNCKNVIILLTDGIEECNEDPCAVARALRSKNITVKPFVVGINLDLSYLEMFKCIGTFFNASDEISFKKALRAVLGQAIHNTTVQVNLNNIFNKPIETNVPMSFHDSRSGQLVYSYVHALNEKNLPDTVNVNPLPTYRLTVHTIPPVEKDNIVLKENQHNTIELNTPQGFIDLKTSNNKMYHKIPCIVRKKDEMKTIHVQHFGEIEKYLVGKYDLEILTLPRIYMNDVEVKQSSTNNITIQEPGILDYKLNTYVYAALFVSKGGKDTWVCNIKRNQLEGSMALQPGKYKIVYKTQKSKSSEYTFQKGFTIFSGKHSNLKF